MSESELDYRLQPALLDRLTDFAPRERVEAQGRGVLTVAEFRAAVLRDLRWLLNTVNLESAPGEQALDPVVNPRVAESVLNFGMREVNGQFLSGVESHVLGDLVADPIRRFEPRIDPKTVVVRVGAADATGIVMEIEGELWGYPAPEYLVFETRVDLQSGVISIGGES